MAKGDSLKKYKIEQKEKTRDNLKQVIEGLKRSEGLISISNVAKVSGISRATIYANYKDLFDDLNLTNDKEIKQHREALTEKSETIEELKKDNRHLREANQKLMDQIIAAKMMLSLK